MERLKVMLQVVGGHLAIARGQGDDFVPSKLDGASLVDCDVSGLHGHHTLMTVQQSVDDRGVGLRSSSEEKHISLWTTDGCSDSLPGRLTKWVLSVALSLDHVGFAEPLKDVGMRSLSVIASE